MSELNQETIRWLMKLSRLQCSQEEEQHLLEDLNRTLDYINQLNSIDTDAPPCHTVMEGATHWVTSADEVDSTFTQADFFQNVPSIRDGMVAVPPVIKTLT